MKNSSFFLMILFYGIMAPGILMSHEYPGILCAIEGIDGAGKTTLINKLQELFKPTTIPTIYTKEPGSTELGTYLRNLLNDRTIQITTLTEFLLFAADRSEHFSKKIIPHLQQNFLVISDRMADSSQAYQGYLKGLDLKIISQINTWCMHNIEPDIVIYLRITPQDAKTRIIQHRGFATAFEAEYLDKIKSLYQGFETIFQNRNNVVIIDALQDSDTIAQRVFNLLKNKYTEKHAPKI